MKPRGMMLMLIALAALGAASFWAYRYEQRRDRSGMCPYCDRMVHSATAYRLKVGDRVVEACCPRCGMRAQVNQEHEKGGTEWATDLNTGENIPAESAVYVEGGDVQYCAHGEPPMAREPHGASTREYDRCLPTLVAFKTPQEADVYQERHGGRVLSYAQALASVRQQ